MKEWSKEGQGVAGDLVMKIGEPSSLRDKTGEFNRPGVEEISLFIFLLRSSELLNAVIKTTRDIVSEVSKGTQTSNTLYSRVEFLAVPGC